MWSYVINVHYSRKDSFIHSYGMGVYTPFGPTAPCYETHITGESEVKYYSVDELYVPFHHMGAVAMNGSAI